MRERDDVFDRRGRGDDVEVELVLQPLLTIPCAANRGSRSESESERDQSFRLEADPGVVEVQLRACRAGSGSSFKLQLRMLPSPNHTESASADFMLRRLALHTRKIGEQANWNPALNGRKKSSWWLGKKYRGCRRASARPTRARESGNATPRIARSTRSLGGNCSCSSRVDINSLAVHLDQKRKRFPADPIGCTLRRPRLRIRLIKWHFTEQPIVRRG